jgi:2-oxoglutarate dehydrogenase E2 component (dihydrolipoamide succinyltransferase)
VLDSEKTTLELAAPENGRLKILRQAGEMVKVGEAIGQIETDGEPAKEEDKKQKTETEKPKAAETKKPEGKKTPAQKPKSAPGTKAVSDLGNVERPEKVAAKSGELKPTIVESEESVDKMEAGQVSGPVQAGIQTSQAGRTTVQQGEKIVPMTMLRRTAAKRLVEAKQQMAMLTTFNEVDMSAVQNLRKESQEKFEKRHEVKLGFMSFFVKAVVGGLKQFSQLNAEIRGNDIVYHNRFDIGVAIASERGLVVPVLRDADKMGFAEIEKAIADFAKRSREGRLKPQELEGGTFTITNGGVFGSLLSTPIVNPPQTGILGMHSIQERPVALNGQVVIRPMMFIALTYDHRLVDGREAVLFLRSVKDAIDNPARMLIDV